MVLTTERLTIRLATLKDVDDLLIMQNDEVILQYNCMTPMDQEAMKKSISEPNNQLVIELNSEKRVIGVINLERDWLRYGVESICLSYHLNTFYTGKGYMSEALRAIITFCFEEKKVDVISARVFTPNESSNHLLRKLGFTLEGTLRHAVKAYRDVIYDDNLYALYKWEYKNEQK